MIDKVLKVVAVAFWIAWTALMFYVGWKIGELIF